MYCTDEELNQKVQGSMKVVQTTIYRRFAAFVRRYHDDMVSAGLVGAWKAAQSYDPARGASWSTWLISRVCWEIQDALRLCLGRKRPRPRPRSLDVLIEDGGALGWKDSRAQDPGVPLVRAEVLQTLEKQAGRDGPILRGIAEGRPDGDCQPEMGCSKANISLRKHALLQRLQRDSVRELLV